MTSAELLLTRSSFSPKVLDPNKTCWLYINSTTFQGLTIVNAFAEQVLILEYEVPLSPEDGIVTEDMAAIPAEYSVKDRVDK